MKIDIVYFMREREERVNESEIECKKEREESDNERVRA